MQSVADLRAELKVMRETHKDHQCVSKMKKADISNLIERMKGELKQGQPTEGCFANAELAIPIKKAALAISKADKPVAEAKAKAMKPPKESLPSKESLPPKEDMKARMARIRAMRK